MTNAIAVPMMLATGMLGAALLIGCQQTGSGQQPLAEVHVDVTEQGFEPAEVKVPTGRPVTIVMTRKTDQTCAKSVEFASLHKSYELPLDQPVSISLPASSKGTIRYECAMHMLSGRVIIE